MAGERPENTDIGKLREQFEAQGQGHVFRFWDHLDRAGRERLTRQLAGIDLPAVLAGYAATREAHAAPPKLAPAPVVQTPEHAGDRAAFARARERGDSLLAAGRVGVMVVAGGQATRLGYPGPKGAFPLGPVTGRTLFGLQAQKIRRLRSRYGRAVPWYVMTSQATDAETRASFARNDHFGLPARDVFFLQQRMVPSFDFEGKLILERPDHVFENPNGHGGSLTALLCSGALDDMDARGIDTLFYYQVDNPLIRMADPAFLGFHASHEAQVSCKVVRKQDPAEKVGVVAQLGERIGVVEYTEIDDEHRHQRDAAGGLVYWAGSIAVHVFDTAFVRYVAGHADTLLPFHASAKRIPCVDASGCTATPDEPNGHKLERFVFDALPAAERVLVLETPRHEEYSPVKNAEGPESPATARRDLVARYRAWLAAAGIELPPPGTAIEIDHSVIDGPDDARNLGIRQTSEAGDAIRIASGGDT